MGGKHKWTPEEDKKLLEYIDLKMTPAKIQKQEEFSDLAHGAIKARYEKLRRDRKFEVSEQKPPASNKGKHL